MQVYLLMNKHNLKHHNIIILSSYSTIPYSTSRRQTATMMIITTSLSKARQGRRAFQFLHQNQTPSTSTSTSTSSIRSNTFCCAIHSSTLLLPPGQHGHVLVVGLESTSTLVKKNSSFVHFHADAKYRLFSSTSSSLSSAGGGSGSSDNQSSIEITQTVASSEDSGDDSSGDIVIDDGGVGRKKSTQQEEEEKLHDLMSQSKQHYQHANYTEALAVSQEFLSSSIQLFGLNHPVVASAHNNIGLMNRMLGEYELSRASYHDALTIYEGIVGEDHANYAAALNNLGVLDRSQAAIDDNLTFLEKMNYTDRAVEYFESALKIREVELGLEHVHTVTSRSSLGGAIAAQVIQTEVLRQKQRRRKEEARRAKAESKDKNSNDDDDDDDDDDDVKFEKDEEEGRNIVTKYSNKKWKMAETNLRDALRMAIDNPRGQMISISTKPLGGPSKPKGGTARQRRMAAQKNQNKEETEADEQRKDGSSKKENKTAMMPTYLFETLFGMGDTSIKTASSALAAQNLAVFLKTRGDLISSSKASGEQTEETLDSGDMYAEAKNLYIGSLRVRTQLKGDSHPDTVSTKFSLAELIDNLGDEEGANKLRQELIDVYQVDERDEIDSSSSESDGSKPK